MAEWSVLFGLEFVLACQSGGFRAVLVVEQGTELRVARFTKHVELSTSNGVKARNTRHLQHLRCLLTQIPHLCCCGRELYASNFHFSGAHRW